MRSGPFVASRGFRPSDGGPSGSFDLLVEVVCEDDDQLLEILSRVRMAPTVTSTETFVYLKLRKQTYSWGTR